VTGAAGGGREARARRRITRSGDFDAVYRRGRSESDRHLVVYAFRRRDGRGGDPRLGLSVSRKVGGAVARNRVKRVLRERFAEVAPGLPSGTDWVVIARPGVAEHLERNGSAALAERLRELTGRLVARVQEAEAP
jgi:ribonuclease P protein component